MRSGDPERVANEQGLESLGVRIDASGRQKLRRSGKPKWSAGKKTVVILVSLVVLVAAGIGGGYAYLWYRFNQLNKVHISDEVAAQSGQPFTILVIGSDSRVGESAAGAQAFGCRTNQRQHPADGQDDPEQHPQPSRTAINGREGELLEGEEQERDSSQHSDGDDRRVVELQDDDTDQDPKDAEYQRDPPIGRHPRQRGFEHGVGHPVTAGRPIELTDSLLDVLTSHTDFSLQVETDCHSDATS